MRLFLGFQPWPIGGGAKPRNRAAKVEGSRVRVVDNPIHYVAATYYILAANAQ